MAKAVGSAYWPVGVRAYKVYFAVDTGWFTDRVKGVPVVAMPDGLIAITGAGSGVDELVVLMTMPPCAMAGAKMASPAWLASILHTPLVTTVTIELEMVQTGVVSERNKTGSPELAVADTVNSPPTGKL